MKKHKQNVGQLQDGVRSLLAKNGYSFSEDDKALLETILLELEDVANNEKDNGPDDLLKILSLLLKFLKFFGIDNVSGLF